MGLINNEKLYPKDTRITINDEVIGSDKDENGITRNYPMSGILSVINEANELKFSLYKFSNDDANLRKGVFNITGSDFKFSDTDQESNNNTALFNVIKNNKENIILYLKDGTENFGYYHVKNATQNTQSFTFELELINNIKAGNYVLEDTYIFNIGITTSTLTQIQSDWNESNSVQPSYIKNKPVIPTKYTDEEVRDVVGATLVAGSNVTITPNDTANTITISATGSGGIPGATDLSYVPSTRTIESSSGADAVLPFSSAANPGLMKADFYEEGSFVPIIKDSSNGAVYNASTTNGKYVRMGNSVTFEIVFNNIATTGTPSGVVTIVGLPFKYGQGSQTYFGEITDRGTNKGSVSIIGLKTGTNDIGLYYKAGASLSWSPYSSITYTGGVISITGTYITDVYTH